MIRRLLASMGPHSFKCGKARLPPPNINKKQSFNGAALFQVRKDKPHPEKPTSLFGFNGAALFQVRKANNPDLPISAGWMLQWGRTLSSAERPCKSQRESGQMLASMGPHSFKCGKRVRRAHQTLYCTGFNGAALFQVRKGRDSAKSVSPIQIASMGPHSFKCGKDLPSIWFSSRRSCFNGAALFQVRKASLFSLFSWFLLGASMGPHSFKCGKN